MEKSYLVAVLDLFEERHGFTSRGLRLGRGLNKWRGAEHKKLRNATIDSLIAHGTLAFDPKTKLYWRGPNWPSRPEEKPTPKVFRKPSNLRPMPPLGTLPLMQAIDSEGTLWFRHQDPSSNPTRWFAETDLQIEAIMAVVQKQLATIDNKEIPDPFEFIVGHVLASEELIDVELVGVLLAVHRVLGRLKAKLANSFTNDTTLR